MRIKPYISINNPFIVNKSNIESLRLQLKNNIIKYENYLIDRAINNVLKSKSYLDYKERTLLNESTRPKIN